MSDGTYSTVYDSAGNLVSVTEVPGVQATAAIQGLQKKGSQAIANNQTYLALTSPTTAQAVAQVAALTRQVTGIMRLLLQQLDSTAGT